MGYWTTEQSRGVGVPAVQLTTHVKSSTLYGRTVVRSYGRTVVRSYGRTSKFFRLDGLLLFCIIMGLRSASSAVIPIIIVFYFFYKFFLGRFGKERLWRRFATKCI